MTTVLGWYAAGDQDLAGVVDRVVSLPRSRTVAGDALRGDLGARGGCTRLRRVRRSARRRTAKAASSIRSGRCCWTWRRPLNSLSISSLVEDERWGRRSAPRTSCATRNWVATPPSCRQCPDPTTRRRRRHPSAAWAGWPARWSGNGVDVSGENDPLGAAGSVRDEGVADPGDRQVVQLGQEPRSRRRSPLPAHRFDVAESGCEGDHVVGEVEG